MIFVDQFEPVEIESLISQSVPTTRMALNHGPSGIADYMWFSCDGHRIQVERKQIDEILSDIDGTEEQLRRELGNGIEETILLYEGTCEPIPNFAQGVQTWKLSKGGKVMVPGHKYNVSYTGLQAWFDQLDKAGITVKHTSHYIGTAMTLVALFNNSQKKEHTTLRRYIKEHITVNPHNKHVVSLMSIKEGGLGEARAQALIDRYGTFWYTLTQPAEELAETLVGDKRLGMATVQKLFKAIGRTM